MTTEIVLPDIIPFLEKNINGKIKEYNIKYLTNPGDNFGSTLYAITIKIQYDKKVANEHDDDMEFETLNIVAKSPVTNPALTKIFQPEITCIKENGIYQIVYPLLLKLQQENNVPKDQQIDCFPKCYATRISLNSDATIADENALLVLENLVTNGYHLGVRNIGFNAEITFKILEQLAQFHALPIALRLLKPTVFNSKVLPLLSGIDLYRGLGAAKMTTATVRNLKTAGITGNLLETMHQTLKNCESFISDISMQKTEPYSTFTHRDFWMNNLMISNDNNLKIKIFDFQSAAYYSAHVDIAFFLFTSVIMDDLDVNFHKFLKHYHQHFCKNLQQVGCSLDDYSYESFYEAMIRYSKLELSHSIFMHRVLMSEGHAGVDDVDDDFFFKDDNLGDKFYNKIKRIAMLFEKYIF